MCNYFRVSLQIVRQLMLILW